MMTDKYLRVCTDQDFDSVAVSDVVSTDSIDLSTVRDMGSGTELEFHITCTETFTSGGALTVTFRAIAADNAALTSNAVILSSSNAFAVGSAELTQDSANTGKNAGSPVILKVNARDLNIPGTAKKYLGLRFSIGGAAVTGGGKITADLVMDVQSRRAYYASGFTVS